MNAFLRAAGIRALRTFAQTVVALAPSTAVAFGSVDWLLTASTALTAALLSMATSVALGLPETPIAVPVVIVDEPGKHAEQE